VQDEDTIAPLSLTYSDGLRYPHLVRAAGTPDLLNEILTPTTPAPNQAKPDGQH
jgi:hypothetical protein